MDEKFTLRVTKGFSFFLSSAGRAEGFSSNTIMKHNYGLYSHSGVLGVQSNKGNLWTGNYTTSGNTGARNDDANILPSLFKYDVVDEGTGSPTPQADYYPHTVVSSGSWFVLHTDNEVKCQDLGWSDRIIGCEGSEITDEDRLIAEGFTGNWNEADLWIAQRNLYGKLLRCEELRAVDGMFSFFDNFGQAESQRLLSEIEARTANTFYETASDSLIETYSRTLELLHKQSDSLTELYNAEVTEPIKLFISYQIVSLSQQMNQINDLLQQSLLLKENSVKFEASELIYDNLSTSYNEKYEKNGQELNDIYLNGVVMENGKFNDDQNKSLVDIANQCPYSGGQAVYSARAILASIHGPKYYDDRDICLQDNIAWRKKQEVKPSIKYEVATIKPNPASSQITIDYILEDKSNAEFLLWNALGKVVKREEMFSNQTSVSINIGGLETGLYYYQIGNRKGIISDGKLSIIR